MVNSSREELAKAVGDDFTNVAGAQGNYSPEELGDWGAKRWLGQILNVVNIKAKRIRTIKKKMSKVGLEEVQIKKKIA